MKKILFGVIVALMLLFAAGCKDTVTPPQDNGGNTGGTPEAVTLKERINNAKAGEEIDLGKETLIISEGESYTVDKAITIKNGDAKNATFTITGNGATLKNMRNIESVIAGEELGNGDLAIRNCYEIEELHVNGGGANSIHISATIILNMEVNKENVRIVLEDETGATSKASIKNAEINVSCTLDSDDAQTVFENVTVSAEVEKVTVNGKANVEKIVVQTKEDGTTNAIITVSTDVNLGYVTDDKEDDIKDTVVKDESKESNPTGMWKASDLDGTLYFLFLYTDSEWMVIADGEEEGYGTYSFSENKLILTNGTYSDTLEIENSGNKLFFSYDDMEWVKLSESTENPFMGLWWTDTALEDEGKYYTVYQFLLIDETSVIFLDFERDVISIDSGDVWSYQYDSGNAINLENASQSQTLSIENDGTIKFNNRVFTKDSLF